jgi:creatinine amidohydrolase
LRAINCLEVYVLEELYVVKGPKTMAEMTWTEVAEEIKKGAKTAILVVGANEQHGPHNPMFLDTIICVEHAKIAATKLLKEGIRVLIAPSIPYGMSHHHLPFPGSIALRASTLTNLIVDVCQSLVDSGIEKILLVVGHSGLEQISCIANARLEVVERFGVAVGIFDRAAQPFSKEDKAKILKDIPPWSTAHAGEGETAEMMAIAPKLVDKSKLTKNVPKEAEVFYSVTPALRYPCRKGGKKLKSGRYTIVPGPMDFTAGKGFAGDVTVATEETGRKLNERTADQMVSFIKRMIEVADKYD